MEITGGFNLGAKVVQFRLWEFGWSVTLLARV